MEHNLQLPKEFEHFNQTPKVSGSKTLDQWTSYFAPLIAFDESIEPEFKARKKKMDRLGVMGLLFFVLAFLSIFPSAIMATPIYAILGWSVFAVIAVVYKVVDAIYMRPYRQADVDNRLKDHVLPLISALGQDCKKTQKIEMAFDFSNALQPVSDDRIPEFHPPVTKLKMSEQTWFNGQYSMLDDSVVRFSFTKLVTEKTVKKRNRRGKVKWKTKVKYKHSAELILKVSKLCYTAKEAKALADAFVLDGRCRAKIRAHEDADSFGYKIALSRSSASEEDVIGVSPVIQSLGKVFATLQPVSLVSIA
jgi:hypothetical protein